MGALAQQRRGAAQPLGSAASAPGGQAMSLEAAVPTEVIALYTAIIAACESVLSDDPHNTFFTFRLLVYLVTLAATVYVAIHNAKPAMNNVWAAARSPEVLTATLAFAAWGLVIPGSLLYVWLGAAELTVTVVTITATATFLLAVFFAPRLRTTEKPKTRQTANSPWTLTPPGGAPAGSSAANPATTSPPPTGPPPASQSVFARKRERFRRAKQVKFPKGFSGPA